MPAIETGRRKKLDPLVLVVGRCRNSGHFGIARMPYAGRFCIELSATVTDTESVKAENSDDVSILR